MIARAIGGAHPFRIAAETICAWAIPALGALAPAGRAFAFACATRAAVDGRFGILVPYRTFGASGDGGTRALGPWEMRRDGIVARVEVTERDVVDGCEKAIP